MAKQIIGKRKRIVDRAGFYNVPRDISDLSLVSSQYANKLVVQSSFTVTDLDGPIVLVQADDETDFLRAALGKSWELSPHCAANTADVGNCADTNIFGSDWKALKLFLGAPLNLISCQTLPNLPDTEDPFGFNNIFTREKIAITCNIGEKIARPWHWISLIKTGIKEFGSGTEFPPVINAGKVFYDHHHESVNPFEPKELLSIQPAGAASYANYTTYYNERLRSGFYESSTISHFKMNRLPTIYGFMRMLKVLSGDEPYTAVHHIHDYLWDYSPGLYEYAGVTFSSAAPETSDLFTWPSPGEIWTMEKSKEIQYLFNRYPLVAPLTLFGVIGYQNLYPSALQSWSPWQKQKNIISKIIFANSSIHKTKDLDALFEIYFDAYAKQISTMISIPVTDMTAANYDPGVEIAVNTPKATYKWNEGERVNCMERLGSNLVFSPEASRDLFAAAEKFKDNMPYYCQIDFTTDPDSFLGQKMEETFMTKPLAVHLAATAGRALRGNWNFTPLSVLNLFDYEKYDLSEFLSFVEMYEHATYGDLTLQESTISETELIAGTNASGVPRTCIDLPSLFKTYHETTLEDGVYFGDYSISDHDDVRNYISYIDSSVLQEDFDLTDPQNTFWSFLSSNIFYQEIVKAYNIKKRTYMDILNGTPAYSEDLFYKIEKYRREYNPDTGTDKDTFIQNIFIPNTPGLNVVNYVDTQLKYDQRFIYKIYAMRVIFGAKYYYEWSLGDSLHTPYEHQTDVYSKALQDGTGLLESDIPAIADLPHAESADGIFLGLAFSHDSNQNLAYQGIYNDFGATLVVTTEPSIKIIEDKIFETGEVIILDVPPPAPDVNILPYYAINNRLKIVLDGVVARYREQPASILNTDSAQINKMLTAQNSPDGKLQFGADDSANIFQIFRITEKPTSYLDFEFHPDIATTVGNVYEEQILPNKKYYYTFRSVDGHGHFGNPTYVYEVELIDDHGAVKPMIRTFALEPEKQKEDIKDFQKYIYIKPSISRLLSADNEINTIFSEQDNKKRFKMRLISKTSGKKLDVNFSVHKKQTSLI